MIYLFGFVFIIYILFTGIDAAIEEYKQGKLLKKEKYIAMGRAAYDSGSHGEEVESVGCGSYFVIFVVSAIIIFEIIYLGG